MRGKMTIIFLAIVTIAIAYNAICWEANDIAKLYARPRLHELKDESEKEKELMFYATFNHENNIMWRSLFLTGIIATICIYMYMKNAYSSENAELSAFIILAIIFLTNYMNHIYRNFHIYRVMASKVRPEYHVMETIGSSNILKPRKRKIRL
jgi:hypothetical protein